ncbi:MAG: DUF308 domain-containing protein [Leucobacter sp.]
MSAAATNIEQSATPEVPVSFAVRLIRVVVLLASGMAIAFSATLHEQLGFDLGLTSAALGAIGIAHLIEWVSRRSTAPSVVPLIAGVVSVVAAIAVPLTGSAVGFAMTIAAWSLVSALLEFFGGVARPGSRPDALLLGFIGVLLAVLALLVREDQVAVLGFFGAYAVIAGVFLGISAFDARRKAGAPASADSDR